MRIIRAILPDWAREHTPNLPKVEEGEFDDAKIRYLNSFGYNIYYLPNYPSTRNESRYVSGMEINTFNWVFVDMDLKDGVYASKDAFLETIAHFELKPTKVVDSGNGLHVYWRVTDLDAMTYLRLQRRLMRKFDTDTAVCQIYQLLRLPGTLNTKDKFEQKECCYLYQAEDAYTAEELDSVLPKISFEDEQYCKDHFNNTYNPEAKKAIDSRLPVKFGALLSKNQEVKDLWTSNWDGSNDDRSGADYRIAHIMFASGFSKSEATSVLVNSPKAMERYPKSQMTYAENIADKIWTYEIDGALSNSVASILKRPKDTLQGKRFACHRFIDDTALGFRLGQVIGLVAGSGVGKTTMAMNMFRWFIESNPEFDHFFVSLEQPDEEIAARWVTVCEGDDRLHDKVHILSNYGADGQFRHLSLDDIRSYLLEFKEKSKKPIGAVVIDHIGALKKQSKNGESQGLIEICHQMKGFAVETNTMVIMQSQAPREKAGIGDLELNKDAAFGTVFFEAYVDYLITLWQPLKRVYNEGAPTIMSFKFCKIRHKKQLIDNIKEDICYQLYYDTNTEQLRELTQVEETQASYYVHRATNIRKKDRKTDVVSYVSRRLDITTQEGNTP